MWTVLKIVFLLLIMLLLFFPVLPMPVKLRRFSTFYALRYKAPNQKRNAPFILLPILELVIFAILAQLLDTVSSAITSVPFIANLLNKPSAAVKFDLTLALKVILVNLLVLYVLIILKAIFKKAFLDKRFAKRDAEREKLLAEGKEDEPEHLSDKISRAIASIFYQGENLQYAKVWVMRAEQALQTFIYIVEALYALIFLSMLLAMFFPVPSFIYSILLFVTDKMYLYPFISLVLLQEICHTLHAETEKPGDAEKPAVIRKEEEEAEEAAANLEALRKTLFRRFGKEHAIRHFSPPRRAKVADYEWTNQTYDAALRFIRDRMQKRSGHVVQSYMQGLDSLFSDRHLYFGASFYSELGEYLIAYTYVRLLSGERVIFILHDKSHVDTLKTYIGRRLTTLTGATNDCTWRIRDASERLDQADVLIAVPEDFAKDNLTQNNPAFFEEAVNAIFLDADRILNADSYLCTMMASRLQQASGDRIRFIFLSRAIIQGFSTSLKKFFRIHTELIECNSALEHENTTFYLWNRETKNLYEKNGVSGMSLEALIVEEATAKSVDGVRVITDMPLNTTDKDMFKRHRVEINEMHKETPKDSYIICTDDKCNLASTLYAFTRFRGLRTSNLHIISRPYLLREFFMDNAEDYVRRSAYLKPRVTEHAENRRLALLNIFCDATADKYGMPVAEFTEKVDAVIRDAGDKVTCNDLADRVAYLLQNLMRMSDGRSGAPTGMLNTPRNAYSLRKKENETVSFHDARAVERITFHNIEEIFRRVLLINRRVELWLNGVCIGTLESFPDRIRQQYVPGQSLIFNNCEYEIERISEDNGRIYLRGEVTTFRSCLDSVLLRRYTVLSEPTPYNNVAGASTTYTTGRLAGIYLEKQKCSVKAETYGYYNLMSDNQTLDFISGVEGNPALDELTVAAHARNLTDSIALSVTLEARDMPCTDEMRLLLSAVCNEFMKTVFPDAYRCIAVCPVLSKPIDPTIDAESFDMRVKTLYPYFVNDALKAKDTSIELLFINDCEADIGVINMLYSGEARVIAELFSHVYSYLLWLKNKPTLNDDRRHYIYFGSDKMPAVFDLDSCIELLKNCHLRFREGVEVEEEKQEGFCAFCHAPLESGRYYPYGANRFICDNCQREVIESKENAEDAMKAAVSYLSKAYPDLTLPQGITLALHPVRDLPDGQVMTEHYCTIKEADRILSIEEGLPFGNAVLCALRALIFFWQKDNNLFCHFSEAQLYYEEIAYLRNNGALVSADYVVAHLPAKAREKYTELLNAVEGEPNESGERMGDGKFETSFAFIMALVDDIDNEVVPEGEDVPVDPDDLEGDGFLYDPDQTPRFWKRFLRTSAADDIPEESGEGRSESVGTPEAPTSKAKSSFKSGIELIPHEPEEDRNPRIKLYNELARRIADFSSEPVTAHPSISKEEALRIFQYVRYDYPEFFWLSACTYWIATPVRIAPTFRCLNADGKTVNIAQVEKYRRELRKGALPFIKGITKSTPAYEALLTIHRRLILTLDYDKAVDNDAVHKAVIGNKAEEDTFRSLHAALVKHKVVCVGYAVAMQYLLQSVGIVCGSITSEGHEWNVVKLGRDCYHLDATWNDPSTTEDKDTKYKNLVKYSYFCVTSEEIMRETSSHIPEANLFGMIPPFTSVKHNYFRATGAFFTRYDEEKMLSLFTVALEKENNCIAFKCSSKEVFEDVYARISSQNFALVSELVSKAAARFGGKKKRFVEKAFGRFACSRDDELFTVHILLGAGQAL